jgi:hypothetical protein
MGYSVDSYIVSTGMFVIPIESTRFDNLSRDKKK